MQNETYTKFHEQNFTVAGMTLIACTFGLARYGFGLFIPDISRELSIPVNVIGLIAGNSYIGFLCATILAAWLSQRFGPRLPIVLGGGVASLGMMLIATSQNAYMLTLAVFIAGASPGFSYPPFSEIIMRGIALKKRNYIYAWINSGTGFGVALASPIVLFSAFQWRIAYIIFSVLVLIVAIWNYFTTGRLLPKNQSVKWQKTSLPAKKEQSNHKKLTATGRFKDEFRMVIQFPIGHFLFFVAFIYGLLSSVYWTFAVDLLYAACHVDNVRIMFWTVLGVAGICGFIAGWFVRWFGLRWSYRILILCTALSTGMLPFFALNNYAIYISAGIFGLSFIVVTAFLGMWCLRIFEWAPAMGFAITFFLISLGQGIGPMLIGFALDFGVSISFIFLLFGLLCALLVFLVPPRVGYYLPVLRS